MKSLVSVRLVAIAMAVLLISMALVTDAQAFRMIQNTGVGRTSAGAAVACNASGGFAHWANGSIAWYHNTGGQGAGKQTALQNGMQSWTSVGPATHNLSYAGTTTAGFVTDNRNTVLWARGNGCNGNCLAITALVLASGQVITETDVSFSSRYSWNTNGSNYDVQAVWAHEAGHTLGLHHTEITGSPRPTMYAAYFGTDGRTLESDDAAGLNCAYNRYGLSGARVADQMAASMQLGTAREGVALSSRMRSGTAVLRYRVSEPGKVTLKVYDVAGRLVATLVDGHRGAGEHEVSWDGHSASGRVASGMYFARVQNGTESARSSIVMVQ
jgi:hypothetical protein